MGWHVWRINNWKELNDFVESLNINEEGDQGWYLRGQANADWELEPSLSRLFKGTVLTHRKALGIEHSALSRFQAQAHLFLKPDIINRDLWSVPAWWMLMQHYSCPTRLLDWTESPYVALYFAVEKLLDSDGAIWLFPSSALNTLMDKRFIKIEIGNDESFLSENSPMAVYPIKGMYDTERSVAQQGVYTVCTNILGSHMKIISDAFAGQENSYPLHKVIIPSEIKYQCLSRLRVMNIKASSLFPGLDGVGRSSDEHIRLRVWRISSQKS